MRKKCGKYFWGKMCEDKFLKQKIFDGNIWKLECVANWQNLAENNNLDIYFRRCKENNQELKEPEGFTACSEASSSSFPPPRTPYLPFKADKGFLVGEKTRKSISKSGLPLNVFEVMRELAHMMGLPLNPKEKKRLRWRPSLAMKVQKEAASQWGTTRTPEAPSEADFLMASGMTETGGQR